MSPTTISPPWASFRLNIQVIGQNLTCFKVNMTDSNNNNIYLTALFTPEVKVSDSFTILGL